VMGTHGRRGPERVLLGSTAVDVVRHAPCPVLTQREQPTPRRPGPWRRVLVPVDFSEPSKRALELARELATGHGSTLELLHVVERRALPDFYAPPAPHGEQLEEVRRRCEEELAALMAGSPLPWRAQVAHGRPGAEVVSASADVDLIVIATRGASGLQRLVFGSTAEEVLRGAFCPVLTLRGGGRPGREGSSR
jgi:nucleotide-binding universal stress UspA family protein